MTTQTTAATHTRGQKLLALLGAFIIILVIAGQVLKSQREEEAAAEKAEAAKTPAQREVEAKLQAAQQKGQAEAKAKHDADMLNEANRIRVARAVAQAIRDSAREPDSIVFNSLRTDEKANIVCAEFRGRNGFGGYSRQFVIVTPQKTYQDNIAQWNKHCSGELYDIRP